MSWNATDIQQWLGRCADRMIAAAPKFNELDGQLGDGDLGATLEKCAKLMQDGFAGDFDGPAEVSSPTGTASPTPPARKDKPPQPAHYFDPEDNYSGSYYGYFDIPSVTSCRRRTQIAIRTDEEGWKPEPPVEINEDWHDSHWGTRIMTIKDPDGRDMLVQLNGDKGLLDGR